MLTTAWHGSPKEFTQFNTEYVFLAKGRHEAERYGVYMYQVTFEGVPAFETPTIYAIRANAVIRVIRA